MSSTRIAAALALCLAPAPSPPAAAAEVLVAVASNFADVAAALAVRFEAATGHAVVLSPGSTGRHFTQIKGGAPFAVFLAADAERPQRLEAEGLAVAGSRFTYAVGRLVLWSPRPGLVDADGAVLAAGSFAHLAIANPELAPYGQAAREALAALGLWDGLAPRLVRGENIAQAYQFVAGGAAELGFVALSQVRRPDRTAAGSLWEVPEGLHAPIVQQAVLLRDEPAARAFLEFLRGDEARAVIAAYGYGAP